MKQIRFLKPQRPYNTGDVAVFPDGEADRYLQAKVAEMAVPSEEDLQDMTIEELRDMADKKGIELPPGRTKKDDLVDIVHEDLEEKMSSSPKDTMAKPGKASYTTKGSAKEASGHDDD